MSAAHPPRPVSARTKQLFPQIRRAVAEAIRAGSTSESMQHATLKVFGVLAIATPAENLRDAVVLLEHVADELRRRPGADIDPLLAQIEIAGMMVLTVLHQHQAAP